jgi:hypothetical protein
MPKYLRPHKQFVLVIIVLVLVVKVHLSLFGLLDRCDLGLCAATVA